MFCMHCGTENSDTAKFCYKCGSRLYPQENETAQSPTGSEPWDDGEEETVFLKRNVETQNRQMEKETLSEETPDSQKGQPDPHEEGHDKSDDERDQRGKKKDGKISLDGFFHAGSLLSARF